MKALKSCFRREPVLCVSLLCALLSFFFLPPSRETLTFPDYRVLCLLFCLMASVAGLGESGLMRLLSSALLHRARSQGMLALLMTLLCFFSSMLMTNDVSLVAFVPLTILVLQEAALPQLLIPIIALETIAANLGSALTPVGNPQNLYLFSAYSMGAGEFFSVTVPLTVVSLLLVVGAVFALRLRGSLSVKTAPVDPPDRRRLLLHGALFVLCLLTVFSVLDYRILLAIVLVALLIGDRPVFRRVDYALLGTFLCFFLFSGNLSRIPAVRELLTGLMEKSAFFASLLTSQVISNVPTALLLAPFTDNARAMILGTDVGGLGTLVASLASLISYKFYARTEGAQAGRYLAVFTLLNVVLLVPLIALSLLLLAAG